MEQLVGFVEEREGSMGTARFGVGNQWTVVPFIDPEETQRRRQCVKKYDDFSFAHTEYGV